MDRECVIVICSILGVFSILFIMLLNYNLKLGVRTASLEKKDGHEQQQINELKELTNSQRVLIGSLQNKVQELEKKLPK
jgi:uncharacterized coiled-coil protein SlyX